MMICTLNRFHGRLAGLAMLFVIAFAASPATSADPLASWNDTAAKQAIIDFVKRVTNDGSPGFVPAAERIATFDNDGTLWGEQPMYVQLAFVLDRVQALSSKHPEWKHEEPYASALKRDIAGVAAAGKAGAMKMLASTHAGMSIDEFDSTVREWIRTARHPDTGEPYTRMVFQPMLELLDYLRENGFKTFIVSGGGIDFMRPWTQQVYGIPPEQVVGSSIKLKFELRDDVPVLLKLPEIDRVDDRDGKPVGIRTHIGRRPIFAAGNSDGDLQMLQYTTIARDRNDTAPRFGLLVHHTDAEREWAYDRGSHVGELDKALDEAPRRGWVVVDMKSDWRRIYPMSDGQDRSGENNE